MSDRSYRSVANPARLGAPERDPSTGRRSSDRSDKDRRSQSPRPRRPWLIAAGVVLAVVLIGGAAAAVMSSGSSDDEVSAGSAPEGQAGAAEEDGGAVDDPEGLSATYDLTSTITEGFSYGLPAGGVAPGPIQDGVGNTSGGPIDVVCDAGTCIVTDIGNALDGPIDEWEVDGRTLVGTGRRPLPDDPDCPPQEDVYTVELTISEDGSVSGTSVSDRDPGLVDCTEGQRSGTRYTRVIEGQRTS